MAKIDREVLLRQLVSQEVDKYYGGLPRSINYTRKKNTPMWSKLSLLCGVAQMKPNELIDSLINELFGATFGGNSE